MDMYLPTSADFAGEDARRASEISGLNDKNLRSLVGVVKDLQQMVVELETTVTVLEELAQTFEEWAGNIEYNNDDQNPEWVGRAKGFREAAAEVRSRVAGCQSRYI